MTSGRLLTLLPAGMVDAGFASLATFAMGFYASTRFAPELLGVYALFFSVFLAAAVVPNQGLFVPAEVVALAEEPAARLWVVPQAIRAAWLPTCASASLVALAAVVAPGSTPGRTLVAFTATAFVATVFSPFQDHVRRSLHLAGVSWRAAAVSAVQLVTVLAAIGGLEASPVDEAWVPFGALAVANVVSLATGLVLARPGRGPRVELGLNLRLLARSGRWLVIAGALPTAAAFVVATLVSALAGSEALGFAEAARILAQPVLVLTTGLVAVLGPRSMEAAARRRRADARRAERVFVVIALAGSAVYLPAVGFDAPWNLLTGLVPNAYAVGGLLAVTILANVVSAVALPAFSELVGGREEARLAGVEAIASAARVAVGLAASVLGAFAVPWALMALGVARLAGYGRARAAMFATPAPSRAAG